MIKKIEVGKSYKAHKGSLVPDLVYTVTSIHFGIGKIASQYLYVSGYGNGGKYKNKPFETNYENFLRLVDSEV